eukprot:Skav207801  [mRNA]  locus=scaffold710:615679:618168:+ [translate_table: standard]
MAPTKHFSAWRLNKSEEKQVDSDLAVWEASQPSGLSEEDRLLKRKEERTLLVRAVQQAKHEASLQKQQSAAAKTKAAARPKASVGSASAAPGPSPSTADNTNGDYYEQVKQDMAVIDKVLGSNLKELMPTPIAAQDQYQLDKAKVALEAHGSYICSCNLYWLDSWKSPAPGVPLSRARVQQLADFYYPEDRNNNFFLKLLEVQVDVASLTEKPAGLVVISPLEIIHAIYLKAAQELGQPGVTAACKTAWSQALTAVPVVMVAVPEGDVWIHALNKRQLVQQEHESLTRTAWQNAAELHHLQALMEKVEGRKLTESEVVSLLKTKHLLTAQKGAGQSAVDVSNYCEWNFTAAKTIFSKLHSDQVIAQIVQKQEMLKGSDSCFNSLVKLEKFAQRPSCAASRRFIFQLIDDMLCHGILKDEDLNKKDIIGSTNNVGLIHLFEFKWRSLGYILDIMCVQAKLKDTDRALLKEHLCDPNAARENTVDSVSWQAALSKSSLEAVTFVQDVVFLKAYDNVIKQAMKPNSHPEILTEIETVQEVWKHVCNLRDNELAEEKALLKSLDEKDAEEEVEDDPGAQGHEHLLKMVRKTPNTLPQGSPQYWKAVANQTVRMYVTFLQEASSPANMVTAVEQLNLAAGEIGKTCTLVHLDTSLLGESLGPGSQEGLRKAWRADELVLQKLLGSTLVALGAQQDKSGKCSAPGEGVVAAVFDPLGVVPKAFLKDACCQTVWVCFQEADR